MSQLHEPLPFAAEVPKTVDPSYNLMFALEAEVPIIVKPDVFFVIPSLFEMPVSSAESSLDICGATRETLEELELFDDELELTIGELELLE